jgi:hypothetical protein
MWDCRDDEGLADQRLRKRGSEMDTTKSLSLVDLIKKFEQHNPDDPTSEVTRGVLGYLRILQECGPEETFMAIDNAICALFPVMRLLAGSDEEGMMMLRLLFAARMKGWTEARRKVRGRQTP